MLAPRQAVVRIPDELSTVDAAPLLCAGRTTFDALRTSGARGGDLVAPSGMMAQAGLDYARALREVKYREAVVSLLMRLYEMAQVDEAQKGSQAQVVDAAVVPDRPNSQFRIWIVLAGLLLALPMALVIALGTEVVEALRTLRRRSDSWSAALENAWGGEAR